MGEKGFISTIQRYSIKDGPGIRSTIFMAGCNLRCKWCANPELLDMYPKYMYFENRCVRCGSCVETAVNNSISLSSNGCIIDRERCTNLGECMEICPKEAFEKIGMEITADDLVKKLLRDEVFYRQSGGGITFSGGEPALQAQFVIEVAQKLRQHGINTALDTAGAVKWDILSNIINHMDVVLYDIKVYETKNHIIFTGIDNGIILENAQRIAKFKKDMIVRLIIVPGFNDSWEDLISRVNFVKTLGSSVKRIDFLRYHKLGVGKYKRLGMKYPIPQIDKFNTKLIEKVMKIAADTGIKVSLQ